MSELGKYQSEKSIVHFGTGAGGLGAFDEILENETNLIRIDDTFEKLFFNRNGIYLFLFNNISDDITLLPANLQIKYNWAHIDIDGIPSSFSKEIIQIQFIDTVTLIKFTLFQNFSMILNKNNFITINAPFQENYELTVLKINDVKNLNLPSFLV